MERLDVIAVTTTNSTNRCKWWTTTVHNNFLCQLLQQITLLRMQSRLRMGKLRQICLMNLCSLNIQLEKQLMWLPPIVLQTFQARQQQEREIQNIRISLWLALNQEIQHEKRLRFVHQRNEKRRIRKRFCRPEWYA